ncbi:DNA replication licensing factor mcm5-A-like [Varroa jacobsoni]|uniref:DNA replication licensing factor MCM5 n=1 Tax=Varroa destructor TaxID=109461 RepID=A0A7M7KDR1_VARDE|nr:DNA replication licensing factor mcm5-A-like [Varroa destructor]XP_022706741.1 DNA replication licensing factor mcm5-A-like [Varroa jacobsoni]
MSGFDNAGVFYSDNFGSESTPNEQQVNYQAIKGRFREFLRQFHEDNFNYRYRDQLKQHYNLGQFWIEVQIEDIASFDEVLADKLAKQPADHIALFEEAATEVADELTRPRPEGEEEVRDVQVMVVSGANPVQMRDLKSDEVATLVKIPGIVVAASGVRAKATKVTLRCRSCQQTVPNIPLKAGLDGLQLPRRCSSAEQAAATGAQRCPLDPYYIVPDKCKCVDFQLIKLQEAPEQVPYGEMPRHLQLYADRSLCERVVPGNRITAIGIYSLRSGSGAKREGGNEKNVGLRFPYLRVVGLLIDSEEMSGAQSRTYTPAEEEKFRNMAASDNIYDRLAKSIAPSIFGSDDVKKAIACLLFGGSRKRLPDGLTRRGDINVLLLGDPGTAKSQLLKFAERVAPVAVYTSGKGSSAAGLTASVIRDPQTRNFVMEGGAMVLADGGVVCIDEFDKMREDDRVAIHEAMEQQTISIAKAGITTTLNTRCAVLAAANSVFGRWDDLKADENINFMPTILSRFDTIFIVKDLHDSAKDKTLARHVMDIHLNSTSAQPTKPKDGELDLHTLKRYIAYCREKCGPRLSAEAAEKLKHRYVIMRNGAKEHERETEKRSSIPITVRQLEAIIRISEALAKMQLLPFATERQVDEALRLFQVSTLDAANSGELQGAEGFTTDEEYQILSRIEQQIKKRFAIGSQVSEQTIIQDFTRQKFPERSIYKVLALMIRRGEVQHRMQRKMLYRLK